MLPITIRVSPFAVVNSVFLSGFNLTPADIEARVRAAIAGHVLGEAKLTGTYTLNPALRSA